MRRLHRRAHVLLWLLILPAALAGLVFAYAARVTAPASDIPADISTETP